MIKFFRKIRQNLLMENKTGKYLKYAIGEILLVIIGILIALQVNNFNEQRKENKINNDILLEIHNNLISDKTNLDQNLEIVKIYTESYNFFENNYNKLPTDTISKLLAKMHFLTNWNANLTGYSRFKENSTEGRIPDILRLSITEHYSYVLSETNTHSANSLTLGSLNRIRDYFVEYGFPITHNSNWIQKPKDSSLISQLVLQPKFLGLLRSHNYNWKIQERGYQKVIERIDDVLKELENYFDNNNIIIKKN